jgi:hypothetical protein
MMIQRRDEREANRFGAGVYRCFLRIGAPQLEVPGLMNNVTSDVFDGGRDVNVEGSIEASHAIKVKVGPDVRAGETTGISGHKNIKSGMRLSFSAMRW